MFPLSFQNLAPDPMNKHGDCGPALQRQPARCMLGSDLRTGRREPCTSYIDLPAGSPLRLPTSAKQLALFDLRPLRAVMPKTIDPETKRLILAFDFYIPVPNPRAATMLVQPKQGAGSR